MKKFEFFGHSDDLFCVSGDFLEEQSDNGKMSYVLRDTSRGGNLLLISGEYSMSSGCWSITLEPLNEALLPLSGWSFEYNPKDYGCQLIVITPASVECCIYEQ